MRALSITRPWAELILRGKSVENRVWKAQQPGRILLHAAKSWEPSALSFAAMAGPDVLAGMSQSPNDHRTGIVGVAEVDSICGNEMVDAGRSWTPCQCGPWAMAGQYHWRLRNVRRLPRPVPCRGALGLWTPPAEVVAEIETQLAEIEVAR